MVLGQQLHAKAAMQRLHVVEVDLAEPVAGVAEHLYLGGQAADRPPTVTPWSSSALSTRRTSPAVIMVATVSLARLMPNPFLAWVVAEAHVGRLAGSGTHAGYHQQPLGL
jgi:hypothetical protein